MVEGDKGIKGNQKMGPFLGLNDRLGSAEGGSEAKTESAEAFHVEAGMGRMGIHAMKTIENIREDCYCYFEISTGFQTFNPNDYLYRSN